MKKSDFENLEELLKSLYVKDKLSTRDVAKKLGVGQTTIRRWLKLYNIDARSIEESVKTSIYLNKKAKLSSLYKKEYVERSIENGSRLIKICPICGKSFETIKSINSTYCSRSCAGKSLEKENTCDRCGKILLNKWSKYCPECLKIVRHDNFYKRIHTICAQCGNDLEVIPSVFNKNEHNFCNVECMSKYYSEHYSGKNSPTWKGGKKHYQGHWLKQRDLARKRDNYTCQLCGVTEDEWHKEMDVHHIKNYRLFENKEDANNLENLVCLCNKCHSFVHSNLNVDNLFIEK